MEQPTKRDFSIKVRKWLNHKIVLSRFSDHYKKGDVLTSMSKCNSIVALVKRDCAEYDLKALFRLLLQHESDLRNILPSTNNKSYTGEQEKLEAILMLAKIYK